VTIDAISRGDIPKFLRRNLLGSEFLAVFSDVVSEEADSDEQKLLKFIDRVISFPHSYAYSDRTTRNAGALIFASLPYISAAKKQTISDFQIDDAIINGTSAPADIVNVTINQLDCRGADLGLLNFSDSTIVSIIASESSMFSPTFPVPKGILLESGEQLSDQEAIVRWLTIRGRNADATITAGVSSARLKRHPVYRLLGQACRIRQYWLRAEDDLYGKKILKNDNWPTLSTVLQTHGFLRQEIRQASGRSSTFVHIKHRERILAEDENDSELLAFYRELEGVAIQGQ
jgi:hypothetical protein